MAKTANQIAAEIREERKRIMDEARAKSRELQEYERTLLFGDKPKGNMAKGERSPDQEGAA